MFCEKCIFETGGVRPAQAELIFAITNDKAGQHYVKFAWKEFTVENIKV